MLLKKLNKESIDKLIEDGFIKKSSHPNGDLFIYNYTEKTQFENYWTPETTQCRGLITDDSGNIVARPFAKFFNIEQHKGSLPVEPFDVYEKLDGSLGILYFYNNAPYIATKGSFTSRQAIEANNMLHSIYKDSVPLLDKKLTYLFEIIYPSNRIVVNYGDHQSLTLLGVVDIESGADLPIDSFVYLGFPIVERHDGLQDIEIITKLNDNNKEGFVIRFKNGLRVKFKFNDYVRLHSIITEMTSKKVWGMFKDNVPFDDFIEQIPDELFSWFKKTEKFFKDEYKKIEETSLSELARIKAVVFSDPSIKIDGTDSRKRLAHLIAPHQYRSVMFCMLDKRDYCQYIWKMLEPDHEIPTIEGLDNYS